MCMEIHPERVKRFPSVSSSRSPHVQVPARVGRKTLGRRDGRRRAARALKQSVTRRSRFVDFNPGQANFGVSRVNQVNQRRLPAGRGGSAPSERRFRPNVGRSRGPMVRRVAPGRVIIPSPRARPSNGGIRHEKPDPRSPAQPGDAPEIALTLQHVLRIYTVGSLLDAWRNPKTQRSIEQVFESPNRPGTPSRPARRGLACSGTGCSGAALAGGGRTIRQAERWRNRGGSGPAASLTRMLSRREVTIDERVQKAPRDRGLSLVGRFTTTTAAITSANAATWFQRTAPSGRRRRTR